MSQVRNIPFDEKRNLFFFRREFYVFEETKQSFQKVLGDVYRPSRANEQCVHLPTNRTFGF